MNLTKIGINLGQKTTAWLKVARKTDVLQTKPIIPSNLPKVSHFTPNLAYDTIQLSNTSYLSDSFVKSLTQIKGKDSSDKARQIIYTILKKEGYKNSEILKVITDPLDSISAGRPGLGGAFITDSGILFLSQKLINLPIEQQIATFYHELDHLDKFVKLYKAVGEKKFQELFVESQKLSPSYDKLVKKGLYIEPTINNDFYRRISDGIDIQDFVVNKWSNALREYISSSPRYCDQYKYFSNPLEISAYNLQSKINGILGKQIETARDLFPKNYISMINSLKRQGITDELKQEEIIQDTINACQLKYLDKRVVEIVRKKINGQKIISNESKCAEQICSQFEKELNSDLRRAVNFSQKVASDAELCINKGLFTVNDVISNL